MNVPIEFTEFIPENVQVVPFRSWKLKADEFNPTVEIRNVLFSGKMIATIIGMVVFMTCVIGIAIAFISLNKFPGPQLPLWGLIPFVCLAGFAPVGIIIAVFLHLVSSNASLWKGEIRLSYDKSSGTLFFPRENTRYSRGDYDTLILGTTDGYDTVKLLQQDKKNQGEAKRITQSYILVRREDGTWARHLIGYDEYSKSVHRAIAKIQAALQCQTAKRTMSLPECYALQHGISDIESKGENPWKIPAFAYGVCAILMLSGLLVAGYGSVQFYYGKVSLSWPSCEGSITHSEVKHGDESSYHAMIRYDYTIDGKEYRGDRYQFGSASGSHASQKQIVAAYPVGAVVKVYYAPNSPKTSVLVPGPNQSVYFMTGFGAVFFLFALGFTLLLRFIASRNNLTAAYTLSEPVIS